MSTPDAALAELLMTLRASAWELLGLPMDETLSEIVDMLSEGRADTTVHDAWMRNLIAAGVEAGIVATLTHAATHDWKQP